MNFVLRLIKGRFNDSIYIETDLKSDYAIIYSKYFDKYAKIKRTEKAFYKFIKYLHGTGYYIFQILLKRIKRIKSKKNPRKQGFYQFCKVYIEEDKYMRITEEWSFFLITRYLKSSGMPNIWQGF